MLKRASSAAWGWIGIGVVLAIITIPFDLWLHRPIFNGLWQQFWGSPGALRWQLLGVSLGVLLAGWGLLTMLFWVGLRLNHWLASRDYQGPNRD